MAIGPSPYDLLLAGLGECAVMTFRMYAQQKQWPLQDARVTLTHDKIHAADCEHCEPNAGKVDRIERLIELDQTRRRPGAAFHDGHLVAIRKTRRC